MHGYLNRVMAVLLAVGMIGIAVYLFGFGQTYEGELEIHATQASTPEHEIGWVSLLPEMRNRRFAQRPVDLDLPPGTSVTYLGEPMDPVDVVEALDGVTVEGRVVHELGGDARVIELELEPHGTSLKDTVLVGSLALIFGSIVVLAWMGRRG